MTKTNPKPPVSMSMARNTARWHCPECGADCVGITTTSDQKRHVARVRFVCGHDPLIVKVKA